MEVITRAQFKSFLDELANSLTDAADGRDVSSSALHAVAHELQMFDTDYLFSARNPVNQQAAPEPDPEPKAWEAYVTRNAHDAKARYLMDIAVVEFDHARTVFLIGKVFKEEYAHSLPMDQIARMVAAQPGSTGTNDADIDIPRYLKWMVRSGFLTSRMINGVRHWEVNFENERLAA